MVTIQQHIVRCRRDRMSLYTTLGLGLWGSLALAALIASGIVAFWP